MSQFPYDCWYESNLLRKILDFPIGEYWRGGQVLSGPEESMRTSPPDPSLPLWMVDYLLSSWGRRRNRVGGGRRRRENPLVKGYCLLHFWTGWNHLIQSPYFTDGEMELEGVIWKDYNLLFFYYIKTKFPADVQSCIPPKYSPRLVKGMQCLLR